VLIQKQFRLALRNSLDMDETGILINDGYFAFLTSRLYDLFFVVISIVLVVISIVFWNRVFRSS